MVHCERCGSEAVPEDGLFDYCVACGLFVCQACWHTSGFCTACAPSLVRSSAARDAALLRRVDRRFREAEREARSLRRAIATRRPRDELSAEVACLELKVASAARVRDRVLGGRISEKRRARLEPLTHRVDRHAAASHTAAARIAGALTPARPRQIPAPEPGPGLFERLRAASSPGRLASVTLGLVVLLAVITGSLASRPSRPAGEGTLSGVPNRTPQPSPSLVAGTPTAASPSQGSAPTSVDTGFDDQRIGPITDAAWGRPPDEARIVAFPTSFDRSVEVRSGNGDAREACFSPTEGRFAVQSLAIDLRLNDDDATIATINLRSESAPGVQIDLGADAVLVTQGGTRIGSGEGLEPAAWLQVGVEATADGVGVRVTPVEGGSSLQILLDIDGLPPAQAVCLGVVGAAGASVHYDNLAITYQRSSEG